MLKNYNLTEGIVQYNQVIAEALPSFNFYPSILTEMDHNGQHLWAMNLPKKDKNQKIILHAQDHLNVSNNIVPELEYIENYYKTDLEDIVVIYWNHNLKEIYNGKLKLIEFPTHSFDWVQHLKNRTNEWYKQIEQRTNKYDVICLNGKPRNFRKLIYNYINKVNTNSFTTIGSNTYTQAPYSKYDFDNADNFIKLLDVYRSADVNVVNETLYRESHGIISEKTLLSFAGLQLPIVIGHKGIVDQLRNSGFDVFDDVLDNSYDTMDNDIRWKQAIDLNIDVINGKLNYNELLPRLLKNRDHLLNGYLDKMITDFLQQVNDTIQ